MKENLTLSITRRSEALIHGITWLFILGFPLLTMTRGSSSNMGLNYIRHLMPPLIYGIVFYVNYGRLVPRFLFAQKKWKFFLCNVCLVIVMSSLLHFVFEWLDTFRQMPFHSHRSSFPPPPGRMPMPPRWGIILRDALTMCFPIALAASIWMSKKWTSAESARKDAEKARIDAELKTLRNQLHPHFLLNSLNNIYALVDIDKERAQLAIQELGKLLRYILYETNQRYIPLENETEIIENYVSLMRLRQPKGVRVDLDINILSDQHSRVAPLIFISLIENAFKHGINSMGQGFVTISLEKTEDGWVKCRTTNSYYPKNKSDKSGSGIGLDQLKNRLELLYPENYKWTHGVTDGGREYISELIINPSCVNVESSI